MHGMISLPFVFIFNLIKIDIIIILDRLQDKILLFWVICHFSGSPYLRGADNPRFKGTPPLCLGLLEPGYHGFDSRTALHLDPYEP